MQCHHNATQDQMRIFWDVPMPMRDGASLLADVFCPLAEGAYPAIMTFGPYGKNQAFQVQTPLPWKRLCRETPEVYEDTTCQYLTWETVDPEKWTRAGYIVIRVDSRGAGRSPGFLDPFCEQEAYDYYDCIEWVGTQSWCTGKVGLLGISYFAITQWCAAALQPPHLAAICPWEGSSDLYREQMRKGGILGGIGNKDGNWWNVMILPGQYGAGKRSYRNPVSGLYAGGEETLPEHALAQNRQNNVEFFRGRELITDGYEGRIPKVENVTVPLLSCGNWGGHNLHLRGNIEGFVRAASTEKWLELHGGTHYTDFYKKEGMALQRSFFDYYLRGIDTGWTRRPPVMLHIRHPHERFTYREETEWPLARTQWTKVYLHPAAQALSSQPVREDSSVSFQAMEEGVTFTTDAFLEPMEITGPLAARLHVSSTTQDADLTLVLRLIDETGEEVTFQGASAPRVSLTMGWLRASHRKTDPEKSLPYRPWHTHDCLQYLSPGKPVAMDVEILPTSIVVPAGYRLALTVQGHDWPESTSFQTDLWDKRPELYAGKTTLHSSQDAPAYLLLPVIPAGSK